MKRVVATVAAAFGVTIALIVGFRVDESGLAVLVGVVCGIVAALPGTALSLYLWWRERAERVRDAQRVAGEARYPVYPPVVILNAGRRADPWVSHLPQAVPQPREFVIVGEEEHPEAAGTR
jgi:hypothetical protein